MGVVGGINQWSSGFMAFQPNQMTGAPGSVVTSLGGLQSTGRPGGAQLGQHQLAYQQQQQLQQQLLAFWANQYQEIKKVTDFKNQSHPWQGSR
ncbi:nuclear transcription factor Y subunit C-3 [Trifolium repens]|jgi:nuclear transcription factor Y gamma|nr:nuclear transcription factor Y subunit C-3 [Trifolium repens]